MSFEQAVSQFETVTAKTLEATIASGDKVIAFIGRPTCPYCQRFAPKMAEAQTQTGAKVYFVDSSDMADQALADLRAKYSVKTVPGLLVAANGEVKVVCDSSISVEDIKAFIA